MFDYAKIAAEPIGFALACSCVSLGIGFLLGIARERFYRAYVIEGKGEGIQVTGSDKPAKPPRR